MDGTECMALKRTEKMNNDDMQKMCEYSPRTQLFINTLMLLKSGYSNILIVVFLFGSDNTTKCSCCHNTS